MGMDMVTAMAMRANTNNLRRNKLQLLELLLDELKLNWRTL
jgi:hypothetical protein